MSKKLILVFVSVIFFSSCRLVFASLTIDEIMYDLSGSDSTNGKSGEWIEIYNPDSDAVSVDASKWRIYDGSANRTINDETDFSIPGNSYVIFAGDKDTFLADNPNFSGTVYDTGITSLNNTGATLKLLDQDGNIVDSVTYSSSEGGAGDGNSLQLINGSWVGATPTPGSANVQSVSSSPVDNDDSGSDNSDNNVDNTSSSTTTSSASTNSSVSTSSSGNATKTKIATVTKIKTTLTAKTYGLAGAPFSFQATTTGVVGEELYSGSYFLNFGDGSSQEMKFPDTQSFTHTYDYPGDYLVSMDYYQNYSSDASVPDASTQINVKIIPADISISNVGNEQNFFIELTNNTDYNADLSNWILASDQKSFKIPRDTIIISKQKITISPEITNFSIADENTLKLMDPEGNTVFDYSNPIVPTVVATTNNSTAVGQSQTKKLKSVAISTLDIPAVNNLTATALSSDGSKNNSRTKIVFILSFIFIGAAAYAVYFIRRKKTAPVAGDDFEILDE